MKYRITLVNTQWPVLTAPCPSHHLVQHKPSTSPDGQNAATKSLRMELLQKTTEATEGVKTVQKKNSLALGLGSNK